VLPGYPSHNKRTGPEIYETLLMEEKRLMMFKLEALLWLLGKKSAGQNSKEGLEY
jgi:hypothetical protein